METRITIGSNERTERHRLIVFSQCGTHIILAHEKGGHHLPIYELPKAVRIADVLTSALRENWNLATVLLFSSMSDARDDGAPVTILEVRNTSCSLPPAMGWFSLNACSNLLGRNEAGLVSQASARTLRRGYETDSQPFGRLGWLEELQTWVATLIDPPNSAILGFHQVNGDERFCVIRFDTASARLWFKAVSERSPSEYFITLGLTERFPQFLPRILGVWPRWHGWLTQDLHTSRLDEKCELRYWMLATRRLAELQIASLSRIPELRGIGCKWRTAPELARQIGGYIDIVRELMSRQPSMPPSTLNEADLKKLGRLLTDCCARVDRNPIAAALVHPDFKGGNIQVNEDCCVFIDWADACISHPFVDLEYLLVHLPKRQSQTSLWRQALIDSYATMWREHFSQGSICDAIRLIPPFASLLRVLPSDGQYSTAQLGSPEFGRYMRSMARRLWREVTGAGLVTAT